MQLVSYLVHGEEPLRYEVNNEGRFYHNSLKTQTSAFNAYVMHDRRPTMAAVCIIRL